MKQREFSEEGRMKASAGSIILALMILCSSSGCLRVGTSPTASGRNVTLPSGHQVQILSVDKVAFTGDVPALMLKYQTSIKAEDKAALQDEVSEVWQAFRPDVEQAGLTSAIVSANNAPTGNGFITHSKVHNFLFRKLNRQWRQVAAPP